MLEVDLVNNSNAGRNDTEGLECLLAPFEKLVALTVALELHVEVQLHRLGPTVVVDLNGVVDDKVHGNERFDDAGLSTQACHGGAHGRKIDEKRNSREVLKHDAGNDEGDLLGCRCLGAPCREGPDILLMNFPAVAVAKNRLEHHADGEGKARDRSHPLFL